METEKRVTGHERMIYMSIITEKDKEIDDLKAEHAKELREKEAMIKFYAKAAETAIDRKKQAIRSADRKARLNLSYALLILVGMTTIPWLLWLIDAAAKNFWLWAA